MMKSLLIVGSLFFSSNSFSNAKAIQPMAKVIKVVGSVTVLPPHETKAKDLKLNDGLFEDSSIVTGEKSLVRIQYNDGSIVVVGSKAKIVIEPTGKQETTLLHLLKGQMRARVVPTTADGKSSDKFFLKTKTAAMGVRGTEFQVMFQPDALRTGLLTFKGEVAIKKIEPGALAKSAEGHSAKNLEMIKEELKKDVQSVKIGDYTNLTPLDSAPSAPVKIDPIQLALLSKDESLGVEKVKVDMKAARAEAKVIAAAYKQEGTSKTANTANSEVKHMGLIDTNTGFYIPPQDKKANSEIGQIGKNGQYIPPKGLTLDANKGFIVTKKDDKVAEAKLAKMNTLIEKQTVPDKDNPYYRRYFDADAE